MESLLESIKEALQMPFTYFFNTGKRIHLLYLASSLILAFYVFRTTRKRGSFFKYIFHKKVWLSKSATIDYCMFFFNGFVKILLIVPYLYFGFELSFWVSDHLTMKFGYINEPLNITQTLIFYTIAITIVNDLMVYLVHLAMHKIPFLWEFHKIHHSATSMNPITQYRIHPVELIINNIQGIFAFGLVTGVFEYLSTGHVSKWMFLGANVFSFLFFVLGANLRHSHVKLRYFNFLEHIFISPTQHQIHHSKARQHWDKNMGSKLAIWDWLFGTLHVSKGVKKISFGLGAGQDPEYSSFSQNMLNPFIKNYHRIKVYGISCWKFLFSSKKEKQQKEKSSTKTNLPSLIDK